MAKGHESGQNPASGRRKSPLIVSTLLLVLGLVLGLAFFVHYVNGPPTKYLPEAGVVAEGVNPSPSRGFRADIQVEVQPTGLLDFFKCPQAHVLLVFSGTPGFWHDQAGRLSNQNRFAVAITNTELDLKNMKVHSGKGFAPIDPENEVTSEADNAAGPNDFKTNKASSNGVDTAKEVKAAELPEGAPVATSETVVTGTINEWRKNWAPIVVEFTATDWVSYRSLGTCYIRLPALTRGNASNVAELQLEKESGSTEVGLRGPVSYGIIRLRTSARLSANDSSPPPSSYASSVEVWSCKFSSSSRNKIVKSPGSLAETADASLYSGVDTDCGAIAVVSHPLAQPVQQLSLILIGVVISIAVDTLRRSPPASK